MNGIVLWDPESGNNDPAKDLAHRGIVAATGCGRPVTTPAPAPAALQHGAGQQGQREIRPVPSRSSLRTPTRPQPAPISVFSHTATSIHPPSSFPGSASVPNYRPITLPPTPVSAASTEGSILPLPFNGLAVATPVSEFNLEVRPDGRMPFGAGSRQSGFGAPSSASPLPSPSDLGHTLGPNGRVSAHAYTNHGYCHSRSFSTDTEHTSSSVGC